MSTARNISFILYLAMITWRCQILNLISHTVIEPGELSHTQKLLYLHYCGTILETYQSIFNLAKSYVIPKGVRRTQYL